MPASRMSSLRALVPAFACALVAIGLVGTPAIAASAASDPGINSSEALKNALMPLYTTKASGSGMGLSLCQEITEAHGGSIGVSNRPEGGAWIRVSLPGGVSNGGADLTRSRLTLTRA